MMPPGPNTDLCRGWTEPDIRRAAAMANDDQAAILREIAAGAPVTLREIAARLDERYEDLVGRMSAWAKKTNTIGVTDRNSSEPSWPWTYDSRSNGNAYVVPQPVRDILLEAIGEVPRYRSFVTLWSNDQLAYARSISSQGELLTHAASSQFNKVGVEVGDHVYVVGTDHGDLLLLGRLVVAEVIDLDEAQQRYGANVYPAPDHLVGSGTALDLNRRVPRAIVAQLERFSGKPFSTPGAGGTVTGNGMRATGRITATSARLLASLTTSEILVPVVEPSEVLSEGRRQVVLQEQVERSSGARARALAMHGTDCMACEFSFSAAYGELGAGFAEVHHIVPISSAGVQIVDPQSDLVVLCANCHRMVHREEPPLTIEELRGHMR